MPATAPCKTNRRAPSRRAVSPGEIERLVAEALYLVPMFARRYVGRGTPFEDLVGAGNLGVVEAAYRYDATRGVKFSTYAGWWVRKAIAAELESSSSVVAIPRYSFVHRRRVLAAIASGRASGLLAFADEDLAASSGMSARQVKHAMAFSSGTVSLESPSGPDGRFRVEDRLAQPAEEGPDALALDGDRARCARAALAGLSERQRLIVMLRFGFGPDESEPASLGQVARKVGLSRERVRQIEVIALRIVRRALASSGWE